MRCINGKSLSISTHTKLLLFSDSAGYCQNPECNQPLFLDTPTTKLHIAEMAHITAAGDGGPRSDPHKTKEERNSFENLILLCPKCHTIIDKAPKDFGLNIIKKWKSDHKNRISKIFGTTLYKNRREAHSAIESIFDENYSVFRNYGPNNSYSCNPESELALVWKKKMLSTILPNNRKIINIIDVNKDKLTNKERESFAEFKQHTEDLERKHLTDEPMTVAKQFPLSILEIFKE